MLTKFWFKKMNHDHGNIFENIYTCKIEMCMQERFK